MLWRSLVTKVTIHAIRVLVSVALAHSGAPAGAVGVGVGAQALTSPSAGAPQWRFGQPPLPAEVIGVGHLSCPSRRVCLAIGFTAGFGSVILRSTDGGSHWSEISEPVQLGSFIGLSCPDPRHCLATTAPGRTSKGAPSAGGVATSTDGGLTWHADNSFPALSSGYFGVVRCVTVSVCYVFNSEASSYLTGGIERTADFGGHWTTERVTGPQAGTLQAVQDASCPTTSVCVAVAQWSRTGKASPLLQTSNGGRTWTIRVAPTKAADLTAVSCGSAEDCLAAGGSGAEADPVASADGGVTWQAAAALPAVGLAWAVTCPSARSCLIAGQVGDGEENDGVTARTTDLGRHWTATKTQRGAGILDVISCPTAVHCVTGRESSGSILPAPADSDGFYVSGNAGASWQKVGLPLSLSELQGVACTTVTVCYAAGGTSGPADDAVVLRSADGGNTWRVVLTTSRFQSLSSISCPTAAECVAVGTQNFGKGSGIARTDDAGRTWQVTRPSAGLADLTDVSCPTTAFCAAIGDAAKGSAPARLLRSADGGRHWTVSRPPSGVDYLQGLSCATGRVCTAVGDGKRPVGPAVILRTTDAGLHWTPQRAPHGATILNSVSCPSVSACDAFSDTSPPTIDVTRDGGARWSVQRLSPNASEAIAPSALSCVTSTFCAGVDLFLTFAGAAFQTVNGKTWQDVALPAHTQWLLGISCTRRGCVAVGVDGEVVLSGSHR